MITYHQILSTSHYQSTGHSRQCVRAITTSQLFPILVGDCSMATIITLSNQSHAVTIYQLVQVLSAHIWCNLWDLYLHLESVISSL